MGRLIRKTDTSSCSSGKLHGYATRKEAKYIARINPLFVGEHMSAYRCNECGYWHLGHLPEIVINGDIDRAELVPKSRMAEWELDHGQQ